MISSCLLLMLAVSVTAQNGLSVDCSSDAVAVSWRPRLDLSEKLDLSRALLGNCPPTFLGSDETLRFYVSLRDCGFHKQVSVQKVMYSSVLVYDRGPGLSFISQPLRCVYDLPPEPDKMTMFSPEDEALDEAAAAEEEEMTFSMELMNSDFSGPASSLTFKMGSSIPIRAEVDSHRSLLMFLEKCVASTDSDISPVSPVHPIISNSGCLIENSTFLPRRVPAEIRLYLQAFKFALGEKIFLHCDLMARDIPSMMVNGKACHFVKESSRWELLDDPSQSSVCSCCESTCPWRPDMRNGVSARKVLGPLIIVEDTSDRSLDTLVSEEGLSESPVWLLVTLVTSLLLTVTVVLAMSYYMCVWRGGRMGYRPRRDLLTKH
ncbi:Zona pellucida sperm-binding protein 3 [Triplophysa tibetana]|uniref:Zona pellucida sperm-binding protein 3 n=1 Tax=Triplophysa tibetana TaxID=1572043 RepID=A0A5A9P334_9TELE|nr:Zona pellucida sperm-binding protein 3 [Triplophysa tibetana]